MRASPPCQRWLPNSLSLYENRGGSPFVRQDKECLLSPRE
jgi:hypothetical protein